jgi:hypothetical protein
MPYTPPSLTEIKQAFFDLHGVSVRFITTAVGARWRSVRQWRSVQSPEQPQQETHAAAGNDNEAATVRRLN